MTPWIGLSLATIAGSLRLFLQTLVALSISAVVIFLSGWLAGFASRIAGQVPDFRAEDFIEPKETKKMDLFIQYSVAAAEMGWRGSRSARRRCWC